MAEVFGSIGNEPVELNNAATESTLRLLLQSSMAANKQSIDSISKIAKNAGLDPATVAAANNNLNNLSSASRTGTAVFNQVGVAGLILERTFYSLDKTLGPMLAQFAQGTATASGLFGQLERLPGVFGAIAGVFQRVAKFQEDNLDAYQKISSAGVNFGGSLTELRMAALKSYMSLTEFSDLMKANGETFSRMGTSADDGARSFVKLSNALLKSGVGDDLRALGYTSQEVNQGMLTYIAATGGRTRQEMQNTAELTKQTAAYLTELDALAEITGKSKEEQLNGAKEAAANQAWQSHLMTLSAEERNKAEVARAEALARGGKAAEVSLMSAAMGFPPMTKAARQYEAVASNMAGVTHKQAAAIKDATVTIDGMKRIGAEYSVAAIKDKERSTTAGLALIMQNGEYAATMSNIHATANKAINSGATTLESSLKQVDDVAKKQKTRQEGEAKAAVEAQKAIQDMGISIMSLLLPAIKLLTPVVNGLIGLFKFVADALLQFKTVTYGLVAALGAYLLLQKARNIADAVNDAKKAGGPGGVRGVVDALKGKPKGIAPLGTMSDPLYVIVLGKGLPGAGRGTPKTPAPGGREPKRPTFEPRSSRTPPVPPTPAPTPPSASPLRAERLERVAEGRAAQAAAATTAKIAGASGVIGGLITAISAYSEIQDINNKKAKGEITEQEASKEKGGVVGEAVGGLGGAAAGAAAGALIGSVIPVLGTAIGGIAGSIIGGFSGSWLGKKAGEGVMGGAEKPKEVTELAAGGIVTGPTLAMVGEGAAPEAVIPLDKLQSMLTVPTKKEAEQMYRSMLIDKAFNLAHAEKITMPGGITGQENSGFLSRISDIISKISPAQTKEKSENNDREFDKSGGLIDNLTFNKSPKTLETVNDQLIALNKVSAEMLRYLKETSDYSRRNVDATRSLNRDFFKA